MNQILRSILSVDHYNLTYHLYSEVLRECCQERSVTSYLCINAVAFHPTAAPSKQNGQLYLASFVVLHTFILVFILS